MLGDISCELSGATGSSLNHPIGHSEQFVPAVSGWYWPCVQAAHVWAPVVFVYCPDEHSKH